MISIAIRALGYRGAATAQVLSWTFLTALIFSACLSGNCNITTSLSSVRRNTYLRTGTMLRALITTLALTATIASAVPAYPVMFDPASLNSRDTVVARDELLERAAAEELARRIVFWPQLKDTKA